MDDYGNVMGGKLSFKGSNSVDLKPKTKKKKKKKDKKKHKRACIDEDKDVVVEETLTSDSVIIENNGLTDAQKRHKKFKSKREEKEIETIASKTYREHVEEYNQKLGSMSEHHDLPRISAAGNG